MKIERLDVYWVRKPLIHPFRTAYGELTTTSSIFVRMQGETAFGWGEVGTVDEPVCCAEHTSGVLCTLRDHFAPRIVGQDIASGGHILRRLAIFKGNEFAKACLEIPWWVLEAKTRSLPLHKLLGGEAEVVAVGADFGVQSSLELLLKKIQVSVDKGYPRVKLKFRPGWDLNMLDAVRSTFPHFPFHIDCNAAYSLEDIDLFRKVDRYHLEMIEQPLEDDGLSLYNHAELQRAIETPICLDESIHDLSDARLALRLNSCRFVNIKVGRVGGLTPALAIHDLCAEHDVPCWVGSMLESAVGGGINLELCTLPNFTYPGDVFQSDDFFRRDIAAPRMALTGAGEMTASQVPGIPFEPVPQLLDEYTVDGFSIDSQLHVESIV